MQQVQLYIGNDRVELFKDETISLTQTIQNVKDIAKVFTDFTKTFTVPASKNNNKIFKHYYNFDIVGGFDARLKTSGSIKLNGIDFKKGNIKLEGVDLKDNKPNAYRVTFFGDLTSLKDLIGDDKLDSLTYLNEFSLEYSTTEIKSHLTSNNNVTVGSETYTNPIIAPLITHSKRLFYDSDSGHSHDDQYSGNLYYQEGSGHSHGVLWSDLKYAIRIYCILRAIEEKYSINFSGGFFESSNTLLDNLYMWLHRKSGSFETSIEGDLYSKYVDNWTLDDNILSISAGGIPAILEATATGVDARNTDTNTKGINGYYYRLSISPQASDAGIPYDVIIYKDGVEHYKETGITGYFSTELFDAPKIESDGFITMELRSKDTMTFDDVSWYWSYTDDYSVVSSERINYTTGTVTILATAEFAITQQIPEMKVIDFLTGLFKMFNLTAYVESNGDINVQPLDDYYTDETIDITKYIDISSSKSDVALPFKNVDFRYEGNQTILADKYKQLENKYFGQEEYKGGSDLRWVGKDYEVKLPFEHLMYERLIDENTGGNTDVIVGLMVDNNLNPIKGKPLLFFSQLISGDPGDITDISFRDNETTHTEIDTYFIPSNYQNIYNQASQSIHFSAERSEYFNQQLLNSLFETYYKNYIQSVFQKNKRIIKKKCFLPLNILIKENILSYVIIDNGKKYRINSITTNLKTGESDIELLNEA